MPQLSTREQDWRIVKFLRTLSLIVLNLVLALGLVGAVSASPADAAPTKKGHTTIQSGLLDLAPLLGIEVSVLPPASGDGFPVVGNVKATGVLMHVGGYELHEESRGTLTLSNFHLDVEAGVMSVVVDDHERVDMFDVMPTDDPATFELHFTEEGAAIVSAYVNFLGVPQPGALFGTATTTADLS